MAGTPGEADGEAVGLGAVAEGVALRPLGSASVRHAASMATATSAGKNPLRFTGTVCPFHRHARGGSASAA